MLNFVYADSYGNIFDSKDFFALGRLGDSFVEPSEDEFIPLPEGTSLTLIPDRRPLAMDKNGQFGLYEEGFFAVGALLAQGYTRTLLPAFLKEEEGKPLPLFGYSAVAMKDGQFYVAAKRTDVDEFWNPKNFNTGDLEHRIKNLEKRFPDNRLVKHLGHCSLEYGCFTAQNIFYERWEGGIPVSPTCNARCLGCISLQESESCPSPQERIKFCPSVAEVSELMRNHLEKDSKNIISFGQGCEGEPSLQADLISESIKRTREKTESGTINMNSNAGYTAGIKKIVDSGLNSLRVSLNSCNETSYNAYYKPKNYSFKNVEESIAYAKEKGVYIYLNLLSFPGINDSSEEIEDLINFSKRLKIDAIQIRNLNIDPDLFLEIIRPRGEMLGVLNFLEILKEELPEVKIGNYTKAL